MEKSQKEGSVRPRRSRTSPPPENGGGSASLTGLGFGGFEIPRFRGEHATLAALAAQLRAAEAGEGEEQIALLSGRLARQLARRQVELREVLGLTERSLAVTVDPSLVQDLARFWVTAGDPANAARILSSIAQDVPSEQRNELLVQAGLWYARAGLEARAVETLRGAVASSEEAAPAEWLGALGFWAEIEPREAADAYLLAAERRSKTGEDALAFENLQRAFEVAPDHLRAAEALSEALVARGRRGAADEVLRAHLRFGSAAARVAYHQRRFVRSLEARDAGGALAAAVEAGLDIELDPERLVELLARTPEGPPTDLEGFLIQLASAEILGNPESFQEWLVALLELHVADWEPALLERILGLAARRWPAARARAAERPADPARLAELGRALATERDPARVRAIREEWARAEVARGGFSEALDVLEPLLVEPPTDRRAAALALLVAGRARDPVARARALAQMALVLPERAGAELGAVAAELLLADGLLSEARAASAHAVASDSSSERAVAAQAFVALRVPEDASAGVLETSLAVLVARGETCTVLARAAERRGATRLALTWAERAVRLRPGDPHVVREHLSLVERSGDAERLARAIEACLEIPIALGRLGGSIARSLRSLFRLEPSLAESAARLVLERAAFDASCRAAVRELAQEGGWGEIAALFFERELVEAPVEDRGALLLQVARSRLAAGQTTAAARAARRAVSRGASLEELRSFAAELPDVLEPDGVLASLELRVEIEDLEDPEGRARRAALLWRLGAARWDMAEDSAGAVGAWLGAADLDPEEGLVRLAKALVLVAGAEEGAKELEKAARQTESPERSGRLLGLAARVALDVPSPAEAFRLAALALERAPLLTELLTVLEQAASPEQTEELGEIYELLARAALGVYGERAVRYRAARQLERRGAHEAALRQAMGAFQCVPAEGVSFVLMMRLADRLGKSAEVVELLEKVAASHGSEEESARWLEKAAALADPSIRGHRQRVDVLLRAVGVRPEEATLRSLEAAFEQLFSVYPEARLELRDKFRAVAEEAIAVSSGAYGALVALALAESALSQFDDIELGHVCLRRAVASDLEIVEYERLTPQVQRLAESPELTRALLDQLGRRLDQEGAPLGRALAELAAACAAALEDRAGAAQILTRAATDNPSDTELVSSARSFAQATGQTELLLVIEDLLPVSERARSLLGRIEAMSVEESLDALLEIDFEAAPPELRAQLLEILADRQERIGRGADARDSYRELLELVPGHELALKGLERASEREQDHEELARILKLRAEASPDPEAARRIQLRRAVVLETQLGRAVEARAVLTELLGRSGDSWAVLRVLADSWERAGDPANAAELWLRARQVAPDVESVVDVSFRAARAYFEAGQARRAREALALIDDGGAETIELRLAVERALGDSRAILEALLQLSNLRRDEPAQVAEWLREAAELALGLGDFERAERAATDSLSPGLESPAMRLLAVQLRVRRAGIADRAAAERVLEELRGVGSLRLAKQREVRVYLLALAREVLEGAEAARRELETALLEQGMVPLLSIALAQRLPGDPERALELYEAAVGGDLLHMLRLGDVLLEAGLLARSLGYFDRAQALLSAIRDDDPRRADAARELEAVLVERARSERQAREAATRRAREAEEDKERSEETARRAREEEESQRRAESLRREEEARQAAEQAAREEQAARAREREAEESARARLAAGLELESDRAAREELARRAREEDALARAEVTRAAREERSSRRPPPLPEEEQEPRASNERQARASDRPAAPASEERGSRRPPAAPVGLVVQEEIVERASRRSERPPLARLTPQDEERLVEALDAGDIGAGIQLLELLQRDRARSRDAVVVAGHLAHWVPGDAEILGRLVNAATRDGNEALALAVRHVLGAFGVGEPVGAPPLGELAEEPEAARAVLYKGLRGGAAEVLAHVWEHAQSLFKKDIAAYGISGVERIPLQSPTPLGGLYRSAARILGNPRAGLYRGKPSEEISLGIAITAPPAVIVTGRLDELSSEFVYHFGAMLAAASPEHALIYGLNPLQLQELLAALALSFGPSDQRSSSVNPEITRIAGFLWETVPPRIQRRLTQLCADRGNLALSLVVETSRRVLRRAGLVVSADLAVAVADACAEAGLPAPRSLVELGRVAGQSPLVADLLGLALSPEYAELRFRVPASSTTGAFSRR